MFCTQCGKKIAEGAKFCGNCGALIHHSSGPTVSTPSTSPPAEQAHPSSSYGSVSSIQQCKDTEKGFFRKLLDGEFGLAKTYWLFVLIPGSIINLIANIVETTSNHESIPEWFLLISFFSYMAYWVVVAIGCWRAASKYQGPAIWPVLAKISISIGWIFLIISLIIYVSLLAGTPQTIQSDRTSVRPPQTSLRMDQSGLPVQSSTEAVQPNIPRAQSERSLSQALRPDSPDAKRRARQLNAAAIELIHAQKYEEAIPLLANAIQLSTRDAEIHGNYGLALRATGSHIPAKAAFENSILANNNLAWTWAYYGMTLSELNDPSAVSACRHFFSIAGYSPSSLKYVTDRTTAVHYCNSAYLEGLGYQ